MKPYHQIPIVECHEPLVSIPLERFAVVSPHPYLKAGADYGGRSPYYLRQSVLDALLRAQDILQQAYPGWRVQIFDAYRPVEVQQYMVDYTFNQVLHERNLHRADLSPIQRQEIWEQVYQIWAIPSFDRATPPPHSTGAAVDATLVDASGNAVAMGSEIDELSPRSHPYYYADRNDSEAQRYHTHREILSSIMLKAGFRRHPGEWWHFSIGDQMWAWLGNPSLPQDAAIARYGRAEVNIPAKAG